MRLWCRRHRKFNNMSDKSENIWWSMDAPTVKSINMRISVIESLKKLGDMRCCYGGGEWISRRCDCKYGGPERSEQTGCPEIKDAVMVLSRMTDDEWTTIIHRKNINEYFTDEDLSTWALNNGWAMEQSSKNKNKYFWTKGSYCIYVDWDGLGVPAINERLRNILSNERQSLVNT